MWCGGLERECFGAGLLLSEGGFCGGGGVCVGCGLGLVGRALRCNMLLEEKVVRKR